MKPASTTSLRAALQLALAVARQGEGEHPPVAAPARLRPYLSFAKAPTAALELCRRVVDDDEGFRRRVAAQATADQVGSLGFLWLTRPDNWEATAAELQAELERERTQTSAARRQDELARREAAAREAAQAAEYARRELATELDTLRAELADARRQLREGQAELDTVRLVADRHEAERQGLIRQLKATEAVLARRAAEQRELRAELDTVRGALDEQLARSRASAAAALAATVPAGDAEPRAAGREPSGDRRGPAEVPCVEPPVAGPATNAQLRPASNAELRSAIGAASAAAEALATALARAAGALDGPQELRAVSATRPGGSPPTVGAPTEAHRARLVQRRALRMPPGTIEDTDLAAEFLVRVPQVLFLVDGYNVAKQGWPDLELRLQRERLVDGLVNLQSRTGAQTDVVFDGVDDGSLQVRVAPARLRVEFTASDVEADDRLLELVELTPLRRPVVVVSNDRRVRDGARRRGANTLSSEQLLGLLR